MTHGSRGLARLRGYAIVTSYSRHSLLALQETKRSLEVGSCHYPKDIFSASRWVHEIAATQIKVDTGQTCLPMTQEEALSKQISKILNFSFKKSMCRVL